MSSQIYRKTGWEKEAPRCFVWETEIIGSDGGHAEHAPVKSSMPSPSGAPVGRDIDSFAAACWQVNGEGDRAAWPPTPPAGLKLKGYQCLRFDIDGGRHYPLEIARRPKRSPKNHRANKYSRATFITLWRSRSWEKFASQHCNGSTYFSTHKGKAFFKTLWLSRYFSFYIGRSA